MKQVFQKTVKQTHLKCSVCEETVTIYRRKGYEKKYGHTKHMYCYKCKEETAHIEIKQLFSHWQG